MSSLFKTLTTPVQSHLVSWWIVRQPKKRFRRSGLQTIQRTVVNSIQSRTFFAAFPTLGYLLTFKSGRSETSTGKRKESFQGADHASIGTNAEDDRREWIEQNLLSFGSAN